MKKLLKKFLISSVFIFFWINARAETTLQFEGIITGIESSIDSAPPVLDDDFKGSITFNETNILTDDNSISSLFLNGEEDPFTLNIVRSYLEEIWINEHKLTEENLVSISPQLVSRFSTANFRLVFRSGSTEATVTGKLNSIFVVQGLTPPPAPVPSANREVNIDSPICEAGADPQVITQGEGTALWWWTQAATSASIDNGIGEIDLFNSDNYIWFYPSETATYTLSAMGEDGTRTTCSTTIIVE